MNKVLVFDNYDSFTYNLVHILEAMNVEVDVVRNDKIHIDEIEKYDNILLSPGPGIPEEAGILLPLIERYGPTKKILGVCLGHQAIAEVYGAELENLAHVYHGKSRQTSITEEDYIFQGISKEFETGRYHSWSVKPDSIKSPLKVLAMDELNLVMAIKHIDYDVRGVQFHPESIMTPEGPGILKNWLFNEN